MATRSPPHIGTLILMSGLSAMVMNVFLPSLNSMVGYFDTEYWVMQMSVTVYLAASAVLQLIIGPLSDKYGRRPVLLWGVCLFMLATLGCIYSPDAGTFLIFRTLQAVMATGMVLSRAAVRDMYDQDKAASMIGYVTMGMALVPMIAPVIGGALDELYDWRASFWLLFVLGMTTFAICWRDMGETARSSGLTIGQQFREYPELLRAVRFWGYALTATFASGAFFAYLGGSAFVGSEVFGLSPFELGLYFGVPSFGYALGNFFTGRFAAKLGIGPLLLIGTISTVVGLGISLVVSLAGYSSALSFFGFMTFVGIGNGMVIPNATAGMLSVRPHLAGTASGLGGAIMVGGGAALGALAGFLLTPESRELPLQWIMFLSSAAAVVTIVLTLRREARLKADN